MNPQNVQNASKSSKMLAYYYFFKKICICSKNLEWRQDLFTGLLALILPTYIPCCLDNPLATCAIQKIIKLWKSQGEGVGFSLDPPQILVIYSC